MAAYVGARILFETIQAAGSTDIEKVKAAARRWTSPRELRDGFG
jgi:hypothetical protein